MKKIILPGGFLFASLCFISSLSFSQAVDSSLYNSLQWRGIGPYRGGRTVGAAGVPQQPNVFYIGVNNGGVWKTTDYGRTWLPIFDDQPTIRVRWNLNPDTPLPPDEPAGQNPPDGAMIDYYLKQEVTGEVTLDIVDNKGKVIRHYSSNDTLYKISEVDIPLNWIRPQQILSAEAGSHRFLWDMHYAPLDLPPSYPISAIYKNTAPQPTSPWVMPGNYTVKLFANGETFSQPLVIKMDPRVKTSLPELQKLHDLALQCYENRKKYPE